MAAGVTDRLGDVSDLVALLEALERGVGKSGLAKYDGNRNHMKVAFLLLLAVVPLLSEKPLHHMPPKPISTVRPQYTKEALDAKIQGVVVLSVTVEADGVPSDVKVVKGLDKWLDEKAVECLRQWR